MANKSTQFSSENQPKQRKARGKSQRTLMLEALKEAGTNEQDFYLKMVERSLNNEDPNSAMLMKEVFSRLYPAAKLTYPIYTFKMSKDMKPSEKVEALEQAVSNGELPADVANAIVGIIKDGMAIAKVTDLEEKIAQLEKAIGNG